MRFLLDDFKYGMRKLFRSPGFTLTAVLTLALGVGVITAMFNLVNGLLLRPYAYELPEQLVVLKTTQPPDNDDEADLSFTEFSEIIRRSQAFQEIGIVETDNYNVGRGDSAFWVKGARASATLFRVLGGTPILGRTFLPEEDLPNGPAVVLLGEGLWRRSFGANPAVLNSRIVVDGVMRTVVGVIPASAQIPEPSEASLFVPVSLQQDASKFELRSKRTFFSVARLKPGFTAERATADLRSVDAELRRLYPDTEAEVSTKVLSLREYRSRDLQGMVLRLFLLASLVLLVACLNVATLLIQRGVGRQHEMALRMSLGADSSRIVRLLLTENLILSLAGAVTGVLIGYWLFTFVIHSIPAGLIEDSLTRFTFDLRLIAFLAATALVTTLIFGLAPSLILSRRDVFVQLKAGTNRTSAGTGQRRLRSLLIVGEVALTIVALIAAGLMVRSFRELLQLNLGYTTENVLTIKISPPESQYPERAQRIGFYTRLLDRVKGLPGVRAAAAGRERPLANWTQSSLTLENQSPDEARNNPPVYFQLVSGDYFHACGQKLERGRLFTPGDSFGAPKVAIINETMHRHLWPGQDPIGKRLKVSRVVTGHEDWLTVAGVVGDTLHTGLRDEPVSDVYLPYEQSGFQSLELLVRTNGRPESLIEPIRRELRAIDANIPSDDTATMQEVVGEHLWSEKTSLILLTVFGMLALLMAGVGLYGAIADSISRRNNEIGVRMALGARPADVLRLIFAEASLLVGTGLVLGLVASLIAGRILSSFLFKVQAYDAFTYAAVSVLTCLVALVAVGLPARRATQIRPTLALRE
jgi:putative ABC transport system permease protein